MTTLIIDNYDSFTWNLVQLVGALDGHPIVSRNDMIGMNEIRAMAPARIILSPGPGHPGDPNRTGICGAILEGLGHEIPVLGVCLGHQLIVCAYGGRVILAPEVMHGKASSVHHDGGGILEGVPSPFEAMRYHSLVADPTAIPPALEVTAWCKDGTIMAVRHRQYPVFGVQFHPESFATTSGRTLVSAFLGIGPRHTAPSQTRTTPVGDHA